MATYDSRRTPDEAGAYNILDDSNTLLSQRGVIDPRTGKRYYGDPWERPPADMVPFINNWRNAVKANPGVTGATYKGPTVAPALDQLPTRPSARTSGRKVTVSRNTAGQTASAQNTDVGTVRQAALNNPTLRGYDRTNGAQPDANTPDQNAKSMLLNLAQVFDLDNVVSALNNILPAKPQWPGRVYPAALNNPTLRGKDRTNGAQPPGDYHPVLADYDRTNGAQPPGDYHPVLADYDRANGAQPPGDYHPVLADYDAVNAQPNPAPGVTPATPSTTLANITQPAVQSVAPTSVPPDQEPLIPSIMTNEEMEDRILAELDAIQEQARARQAAVAQQEEIRRQAAAANEAREARLREAMRENYVLNELLPRWDATNAGWRIYSGGDWPPGWWWRPGGNQQGTR